MVIWVSEIQISSEILITMEKIIFQVTWASSKVSFYFPSHSPLLHSAFSFTHCFFSQESAAALGEFNLSLSIDLDAITPVVMSSFGGGEKDSKALLYLRELKS